MKVCLINPPTSQEPFERFLSLDVIPFREYLGRENYFPIGLLSLATVLLKHGLRCELVDINNYFYGKELTEELLDAYILEKLLPRIMGETPDLIGIGCLFSGAFRNLLKIARRIKKDFPEILIVIGGMHATTFAKDILKRYSFVDYIILGEGEYSFLQLVKSLAEKCTIFETIDGLAFRRDGEIIENPKSHFIKDLDRLPFIDYSILNVEEYHNMDTSNWYNPKGLKIGQPFPIISSRSCPNRCSFCSMWLVQGPKFRSRLSENVLDELEYLYDKYGVRYFQFMDDNMTFDRRRALEIFRGIIKRKLDIQFDTPNGLGIRHLDKELIDAMVASGMVMLSVAIESGSEYIRNQVMHKNLKTQKIYEVIESAARYHHLFIKGFFIVGMPQDTHETLQASYDMIKNLPLDKISVNYATPYPGTELFNYCLKNNLLPYKRADYVDVEVYQDSDEHPHFEPHGLTYKDLIEFRKRCFDVIKERRKQSGVPYNFPLRYNKEE